MSARPSPAPPPAPATTREEAQRAVMRFEQIASELRGCALLDPSGRLLAASGEDQEGSWAEWERTASSLLDVADAASGEPAEQVHVATEDGEAFAVRLGGLALVAVTERFVLASLVVSDMRAVLRELASAPKPAASR